MAQTLSAKRLRKELMLLQKEPVENITAVPLENNILVWHYVLKGELGPWTTSKPLRTSHSWYCRLMNLGPCRCEGLALRRGLLSWKAQVPSRVPAQASQHPHAHAQRPLQAQHTALPQHVGLPPRVLEPDVVRQHYLDGLAGKSCGWWVSCRLCFV